MKAITGSAIAIFLLASFAVDVLPQPVTSSPIVRAKPQKKAAGDESAQRDPEKMSENEDKLGPIGVFADIEEGWTREDVARITRHFGEGKVAISIDGGPVGGTFSRDQSHYLLKDLFEYTITEKFEFVQYRNVSDGKVEVYAVAERLYKRNDDGRLFKDKIYVSLRQEDERWVISEIKSIR